MVFRQGREFPQKIIADQGKALETENLGAWQSAFAGFDGMIKLFGCIGF